MVSEFYDDDFKDLDEIEIFLNGKTVKLPDNINELSPEKLEEMIRSQIGDEEEKNIEIKIIKSGKNEE